MIYEFALEPELAARWHDRREYFSFEGKFGMKTGRFISAYPKKWKKMVYDVFMNSPDGQTERPNAINRASGFFAGDIR